MQQILVNMSVPLWRLKEIYVHQWKTKIHCSGKSVDCLYHRIHKAMVSLTARFVGPTWNPSGADRFQVGPMLAPWTLLSDVLFRLSVKGGAIFNSPIQLKLPFAVFRKWNLYDISKVHSMYYQVVTKTTGYMYAIVYGLHRCIHLVGLVKYIAQILFSILLIRKAWWCVTVSLVYCDRCYCESNCRIKNMPLAI